MGDKNLEKKMFPFDKPLTSRDRKNLLSCCHSVYCNIAMEISIMNAK